MGRKHYSTPPPKGKYIRKETQYIYKIIPSKETGIKNETKRDLSKIKQRSWI